MVVTKRKVLVAAAVGCRSFSRSRDSLALAYVACIARFRIRTKL